jgi:riboflavin kinase/FMN adenylyltransferase
MQIITDLKDLKSDSASAIAIGKFDGIHRGHQKLLEAIISQKARGLKSTVVTFEPPPEVFFGWAERKELTTTEEKRRLLAGMGIDRLIEFPMNRQTKALPAIDFVRDILCQKLQMAYICAGTDLTFGDKGAGNGQLLLDLSSQYGYKTKIIDKIGWQGREISSSLIRAEVERGNLSAAAEMLGRNYRLTGTVMMGNQLGRTMGVPTANLYPAGEKILPPGGVYFTRVYVPVQLDDRPQPTFSEDGHISGGLKQYCGISNVGYKPTVSDRNILGVETHLYDFAGDLYGQTIEVEFLDFLRTEKKLSGIEMLKQQLEKDVREGVAFFGLTVG